MFDEKKFLGKITFSRVKWFIYYTVVKDIYGGIKYRIETNWLKAISKESEEKRSRN